MGTKSITKFKINDNIYGFYYGFDGYIEAQGYLCSEYIKVLKDTAKRKHFIDRIGKIYFCNDGDLTYTVGNKFLDFLLNSNDDKIQLCNGWSQKRNEDGTYTDTTYQAILDLSSAEHNKVYNYTGTAEYTYLIDLDEDRFFVNDIEIPQEHWQGSKLLEFYNKIHKEQSMIALRSAETFCIMEQDIKKWFFDKYDGGCNIRDFVKENFLSDDIRWINIEKAEQEILGDKLQNEEYFNQCILESHNMIINGVIHGRHSDFKIEITEYDYRDFSKTEISAEKILTKAMTKAVFLNLFNKYYFTDLTIK